MQEAHAADAITGISSMATRQLLAQLADAYRERSGTRVDVESVGGVDAARRVEAGERFDFVVLASNAIERLGDGRHVDAASRVDIARCGIAIAVRAGAPRPPIHDEGAVRDAVLRASTIGTSTGPSGAHLVQLFDRWGIAARIAGRIVQAPPGIPVASLIAQGQVDLGFQQSSELLDVPGIDVVGPMPPAIQAVTTFSGAIVSTAQRPDPARAFLAFAASPASDPVKRRYGMEPA